MLLLFVGGFGIGGYFGSSSLLGFVITMLMGTASGLALAAAGYFGINFFYRRQGDSSIESREYVGLTGVVVTSIGMGGVGQVRCQIGTSRDTFLARSGDGTAIPINSVVRIVDMVGATAVVEVADSAEQTDFPWRT
jgi:membrane protein implicated in regulation of membrane protease activity